MALAPTVSVPWSNLFIQLLSKLQKLPFILQVMNKISVLIEGMFINNRLEYNHMPRQKPGVWWYIPQLLGRLRQEEDPAQEFKTSLGSIVRPYLKKKQGWWGWGKISHSLTLP